MSDWRDTKRDDLAVKSSPPIHAETLPYRALGVFKSNSYLVVLALFGAFLGGTTLGAFLSYNEALIVQLNSEIEALNQQMLHISQANDVLSATLEVRVSFVTFIEKECLSVLPSAKSKQALCDSIKELYPWVFEVIPQ